MKIRERTSLYLCLTIVLILLLYGNMYKDAIQSRSNINTENIRPVAINQDRSQSGSLSRNSSDTAIHRLPYISQCQRKNIIVTKEECEKFKTFELEDKTMFSFNWVSGAPGSGNDWILWLASTTRYSWSKLSRQLDCEAYRMENRFPNLNQNSNWSCLFIKTHEPWFWKMTKSPARCAFLVRHPYDAIFSEYRRQLVQQGAVNTSFEKLKSSTEGVEIGKFLDIRTNATAPGWKKFLMDSIPKWLRHATYWLKEYSAPLHILVYNNIRQNTTREIEQMQEFFRYNFGGANFRRHCCVMEDSVNKDLKRQPSAVDNYKNFAYDQEVAIRKQIEDALDKVHQMLDERFPNGNYRIRRG